MSGSVNAAVGTRGAVAQPHGYTSLLRSYLSPICTPPVIHSLGLTLSSLPSTLPSFQTQTTMQALNKHYRKKIIRKNFGVHGTHEGTFAEMKRGR